MYVKPLVLVLSILFLAGLSACYPRLSEKGAIVRLENNITTVKNNCSYLGIVSSTSSIGLSEARKYENALNDLRNKSALLGADTLVITNRDSMFREPALRGEAYSCFEDGK